MTEFVFLSGLSFKSFLFICYFIIPLLLHVWPKHCSACILIIKLSEEKLIVECYFVETTCFIFNYLKNMLHFLKQNII